MRLSDLEMRRLLPSWMQADEADIALAQGVDDSITRAAPQLASLTIWDALDVLPESALDELAWALDIQWWEDGASIATKRDLIRNSDLVHMRLGTVAAVESVVASYFGTGKVREWTEYDGLPHHFKVYTTDPSAVAENLDLFLTMLEKVKRKSSVLDGIEIGLMGSQVAHVGISTRITSADTIDLGYSNHK